MPKATRRKPNIEALRQSEERYRTLVNSIDEGFCLIEMIYDQQGQPVDWLYLEANPTFERQTGIDPVGKRVSQVVGPVDGWWFTFYQHVLTSQTPAQTENQLSSLNRWYRIRAAPVTGYPHRLAVIFDDITRRRADQEALRRSEENYRTLFDTIADGLTIFSVLRDEIGQLTDLRYLAINRALAEQTGLDRRTILGQRLSDVLAPADLTRWLQLCTQALATDQPVSFEEYIARVNRWFLVGLYPRGKAELVSSYRDITDRKRNEAALQASEAEFRTMSEAAPALVWVCSASGENIYFNSRWYEYTGQTAEQASGHGWITTLHPEDAAYILPYWERSQQTGEPYEGQVRYRRHDGIYRWHIFRALPRRDEAGQIKAWYGLSIDTDDAKRAQEALQREDQRKDEFLAMLAHELRNPMATLQAGLDILHLTLTEETTRSPLTLMERQMKHVVRMVDDLLDVSRIRRGKIELHPERTNLVELVHQAAASVGVLFAAQGRHLLLDLPSAPMYVSGDTTRLTQVVINLLTNGVRYTGEAGRVWLCLTHHQQEAILQVQDNGIGLEADQLEAIFELFVQVDNSLARSKGGLGLGLTLVKRLVEMHGGRVEAFSEGLGQGSTFRVYLPTLETAPASKPVEKINVLPSNSRVLVIDDNADAVLMLGMLLKLKGYEVHTRQSGQTGIEAAEALQPSAILLDIGMPELDGYETCRRIRQQARGQHVPIIALTGYGQEEDIDRAHQAGFTAHLTKPVDLGKLIDLLEKNQL
ncbi:PAS domain-containing hybrid sensor histidine kinase/response regulator [Spirosoma aerophilum]